MRSIMEIVEPYSAPVPSARISFTSHVATHTMQLAYTAEHAITSVREQEIAEALAASGLPIDTSALLDAVRDAVRQMVDEIRPAQPYSDLTATDVELLAQGGLAIAPLIGDAGSAFARTAATYAEIIASSYTVSQTARLLGVNDSRIRQRLIKGTLYGLKINGEWRVPAFQMYRDKPIPGIEKIFLCLAHDLHPVEVYMWFITPDPDLTAQDEDASLSPREWLIAGHSPERVALLAAEL